MSSTVFLIRGLQYWDCLCSRAKLGTRIEMHLLITLVPFETVRPNVRELTVPNSLADAQA